MVAGGLDGNVGPKSTANGTWWRRGKQAASSQWRVQRRRDPPATPFSCTHDCRTAPCRHACASSRPTCISSCTWTWTRTNLTRHRWGLIDQDVPIPSAAHGRAHGPRTRGPHGPVSTLGICAELCLRVGNDLLLAAWTISLFMLDLCLTPLSSPPPPPDAPCS